MAFDERKYQILEAIIDDYINTAMPVGSRTISRKAGFGFSPATIRNEMSDLEELGYLDQPHTSAGRIPSVKGYRMYVDHLMKRGRLTNDEREQMHENITGSDEVETILRGAANVLADATNYTSVVMAPKLRTMRLRYIALVPVSERKALLVLVTAAGIIKETVIHLSEEMDMDSLHVVSVMLTERLANKPIEGVRQSFSELFRDGIVNRRLLGEVLTVIEEKLDTEDEDDIVVGGRVNLLNYPEFGDVEKAKRFFAVLDDRNTVRKLLSGGGNDLNIRIGPENGVPELTHCSVVTVNYEVGENTHGTLGIIGPIRMNYNRVIPVLDFMARSLSETLSPKRAMLGILGPGTGEE